MADDLPPVIITGLRVDWAEGRTAAAASLVPVGGGTQVKTVDGAPEEVTHPASEVWHVRLLSPDVMIPDKLAEAGSYEEAAQIAQEYAGKLVKHASDLADLASELQS